MLKKIVKYGNSCALVLDKALLELLNMAEGSVVKIKTDGVSLIITPQHALVQETISPTLTVEETLNHALKKRFEQSFDDPQKAEAYREAFKEISDRYIRTVSQKIGTPEAQQALGALQKRFAGDVAHPEYAKAVAALYQQYAPELGQMQQEIDALIQKYVPTPTQEKKTVPTLTGTALFRNIHEKYRHVLAAVSKLNENPEYLHEMVLLAEKYQLTENSPQYLEASSRVIAQYIPEYALYQEELKQAAVQLSSL